MSSSIQDTILFIPKQKLNTYKSFPKRKKEQLIKKNSVKLTVDEVKKLNCTYFDTMIENCKPFKYVALPRFFETFLIIVDREINNKIKICDFEDKDDLEQKFSYFGYTPGIPIEYTPKPITILPCKNLSEDFFNSLLPCKNLSEDFFNSLC
jgi:hypothetical protein